MDSKCIGLCPQGFESPRCRFASLRFALKPIPEGAGALATNSERHVAEEDMGHVV